MSNQVKFGVYLNNRAAVFLENYPMSLLLQAATLSEELGYDSAWVGDNILFKPVFEPITTLAAVAERTRTIKLGTAILQPHLRNPVLLALAWATLDVISSGRTILGVGLGGGLGDQVDKQYEVCGVPRKRRGRLFEESVRVLKKLWSEAVVNFSGEYYHLSDVSLPYKPLQKPHPPIWIAASAYLRRKSDGESFSFDSGGEEGRHHGPSIERVAELGDGWWTANILPDEYDETWKKIQALARAAGRDPREVYPALDCWMNINPDREVAQQEAKFIFERYHDIPASANQTTITKVLDRWCIKGPRADCIKQIEEYVSAGAKTIMFVFAARDQLGQIRAFAKDIMPSF